MKISSNHYLTKAFHYGSWLCIILLVLITCVRTLYLFPGTSNILTNADLIQLPTMFLDVNVEPSNFWGWKLPEAPYYFPDTVVFLFVNWLVRDSWHSIAVYSLVQTILVVFILCWLYRSIGGKNKAVFLTVLLLAILTFTNIYTTIFSHTQELINPYIYCLSSYIHFGTYVCTLFCLAISLNYLQTRQKSLLVIIATITLLTTASDLLFAIYFTIPFIATLIIASKNKLLVLDTAVKRFCFIIFSASLTAYIYNKYFDSLAATTLVKIKLSKMILAIKTISIGLWQAAISEKIFLILVIALPLFYLMVIALRLYLKQDLKQGTDTYSFQIITCVYVAIAVVSNIMAVIITGKYITISDARYLMFIYYSPGLVALIFVSLWLEKIKHINRLAIATIVALTIVASTSIATQEFPAISQILSPPDYANCFDLDRSQAGLAGYWQSKPLITFSQRKIQIATIEENGEPYTWNSNRYWYTDSWIEPGSPPQFQFILMKSLESKEIASRYGKPDRIQVCNDSEIWRYDDSSALYSNLMKDGL